MDRLSMLEDQFKQRLDLISKALDQNSDYAGFDNDLSEALELHKAILAEEKLISDMSESERKLHVQDKKDILLAIGSIAGVIIPSLIKLLEISTNIKNNKADLNYRIETRDMVFRHEYVNDQIFTSTPGKDLARTVIKR